MSTLSEIAANHARMAKLQAQESSGLSERHVQIVGCFEVPVMEEQQHIPLHLIAGVQDNHLAQAAGYLL
ncbi:MULTISPECIES: hypothetical protein [unclassified Pseudomonas]|uniref:hypothetical protein n=1 Tax=unclassified Pseudomonas TaxID=196821 RepID=UPI00048795E4|nr:MULTISPECIES: hypothetical protein [unclassified Pseudomonas]CRL47567.1 hypothetical protein PSHI_05920 [Pseudomonas sp. URMO17WK12:I11]